MSKTHGPVRFLSSASYADSVASSLKRDECQRRNPDQGRGGRIQKQLRREGGLSYRVVCWCVCVRECVCIRECVGVSESVCVLESVWVCQRVCVCIRECVGVSESVCVSESVYVYVFISVQAWHLGAK